MNKKRIICDFK